MHVCFSELGVGLDSVHMYVLFIIVSGMVKLLLFLHKKVSLIRKGWGRLVG